jgi:hypothetical protein
LTASYASSSRSRLIHLLKNAPRVIQEQLPRGTYLYAARQAVKQFEAEFLFQILNLEREGGLSHAQPPGRAPVVLLLADRQKIS